MEIGGAEDIEINTQNVAIDNRASNLFQISGSINQGNMFATR